MADPLLPLGNIVEHGESTLFRLPLSVCLRHALVTGTTGWGKSGFLLTVLLRLLKRHPQVRLTLVDLKGETAATLRDQFLPVLIEQLPHLAPEQICHVRFFSPYPIPFNCLLPVPGLAPEVQANLVCGSLSSLMDGLGPRMQTVLSWLVRAGMDARGSLLDVLRVLQEDVLAEALARHVAAPEIRHYLTAIYPQEPAATKNALRARLEWLLLVPQIRAALCAPGCLHGADILESPLAIVDLSGAPQGFVGLSTFVGSLVFQFLVGAIFARPVTPTTSPGLLVIDEWQELVKYAHSDVERLLALARFKKLGLWLANQSPSQIAAVSQPLLQSLLTNIALHLAFRPEPGDIKHLLPLLPLTGRAVDPLRPDQLLSRDEERRRLLETLSRLPPRWALLADRVHGHASIIRTLNLPYARVEQATTALPPELLDRFARGSHGVPIAELRPVQVLSPPGEGGNTAARPSRGARPRRRTSSPPGRRKRPSTLELP